MVQRNSGFHRVHDDQYETPAEPVIALVPYLEGVSRAWDPCNPRLWQTDRRVEGLLH
jgi:hypothetical protein